MAMRDPSLLQNSSQTWKLEQLNVLESKKKRLQQARQSQSAASAPPVERRLTRLSLEFSAISNLTRLLAKFQSPSQDTASDLATASTTHPSESTNRLDETLATQMTEPEHDEHSSLPRGMQSLDDSIQLMSHRDAKPRRPSPSRDRKPRPTSHTPRRPPQLNNPLHSRHSRRNLKSAPRDRFVEGVGKDDSQIVRQYVEQMSRFVPLRVMELYVDCASQDESKISVFHEEIEAAVLFADMSGFSKLAEDLEAKLGRTRAAKNLGESVAAAMQPLVNLIVEFGGDIVKFAGDAVFAVYDTRSHDTLALACTSACLTARRMTLFHNHNAASNIGFQVHCGVGVGKLTGIHVGGIRQRWEYAVYGEALQQSVSCESDASAGEVVISNVVRGYLGELAQVKQIEESSNYKLVSVLGESLGRFHERTTQRIFEAVTAMDRPSLHSLYRYVMPYVPEPVIDSIECGRGVWVGSVRRCVTMFIRLNHVSYAVLDIHTAVRQVQKNLYAFPGSTFCRLIIDDKGLTTLWAFGMTDRAPNNPSHNYSVSALTAAFRLQEALKERGQSCSIGITAGRVYCGTVGGAQRCEYTLHGTQVNLAARLMVGAKDGILVDQEMYNATSSVYAFEPPTMMLFKGKTRQISVFRPKSAEVATIPPLRVKIDSNTPNHSPRVKQQSADLKTVPCNLKRRVPTGPAPPITTDNNNNNNPAPIPPFTHQESFLSALSHLSGASSSDNDDRVENESRPWSRSTNTSKSARELAVKKAVLAANKPEGATKAKPKPTPWSRWNGTRKK